LRGGYGLEPARKILLICVKVKTYGELQRLNSPKGEEFVVELQEGASVKRLMEVLDLPNHQVMLVLKNGQKADEGDNLVDGDAVSLYPVVGGG